MPIVIPKALPAFDILSKENIFCMGKARAEIQDIRPIEIAIVNLMPTKVETETQLMRLLANSSLQVNVTLIKTTSYTPTHTSKSHMDEFYKTFDEIKDKRFDGMIVTGAPVEQFDFEKVAYWDELCKIMDYAESMVTSTIYICWSAQASLNYFYGVEKYTLDEKLFGIFKNKRMSLTDPLVRGLDDYCFIPHSRHTTVNEEAIKNNKDLIILAEGKDCGISIVKCVDNKKFFFFGHSEYDRETLKREYERDLGKGLPIKKPHNYFVEDSTTEINMSWKSTGNLLFYNWLNYYVYQVTPYNIGR